MKLIIHTASLYYWFDDYEAHLDDRIHIALDAGLDGVEISNGPSILTWQPQPETIKRLKNATVTIHAEIGPDFGCNLDTWAKAVSQLPFDFINAVFHPDELAGMAEFYQLTKIPFPCSLENMDKDKPNWQTFPQIRQYLFYGLGFTFDTAHAEENRLPFSHFASLPLSEIHLSIPNDDYYNDRGYSTGHAMTQLRPKDFPIVPDCPLVVLEGLVPPDMDLLKDEVDFVREHLK